MLGASLLERSSRGVELTDCGRLLLARARAIFDEIRQGVKDIERRSDPASGEVRIGTTEPLTVVLSKSITRLSLKYPKISYHVTVGDTTTQVRLLRERALDVVITRWTESDDADDLSVELLYRAALAVMADRRHPLTRRRGLELADLYQEQWTLSPPDSFLGRIVVDAFRRKKLEIPPAVVITLSVLMRLNLLASGRFLSVLPATMLDHRSTRDWLRALDVDLKESIGPVALITLRRRAASGALALFQQSCREVCKTIS